MPGRILIVMTAGGRRGSRLGGRPMKHVRLFSLLTVLVFLLSSAYAQKLPPTVQTPLVEGVPEERSEEHTSELQTHLNLVCRLLLETKKSANLTVNPAGTNPFSGNYKRKLEGGTW